MRTEKNTQKNLSPTEKCEIPVVVHVNTSNQLDQANSAHVYRKVVRIVIVHTLSI